MPRGVLSEYLPGAPAHVPCKPSIDWSRMARTESEQLMLIFDNLPAFRRARIKDVNRLSGVTKWRTLYIPNVAMRRVHRRMQYELRLLPIPMPHATAGRRGDSPLKNAQRHRGSQHFVLLDLHAAYRHVDPARLAHILCDAAGKPQNLAQVQARLEEFCFVSNGGLATGGLVSVQLFNIYASALIDQPLAALVAGWGDITFTRYLDDLTISSLNPIGRHRRRQILEVIRAAGFEHSIGKAKVVDLARENVVRINGINLDRDGNLSVPRAFKRELFDALKEANAGKPVDHDLLNGLIGAYAGVMGPIFGVPVSASDERIKREIRIYRAERETELVQHERRRRRRAKQRRVRDYKGRRPARWGTLNAKWGKSPWY